MAIHTSHRVESSALASPLDRLVRSTKALADAIHAQNPCLAHRWACEIRDLGWSSALPATAAMAGVLAMRLSDNDASPGEIDLALDETFAEIRRTVARMA